MIGIKCDGCNEMHCVDFRTHMYSDSIPDDWYSFYKGKPDDAKKVSHFCSLMCLHNWLVPQLTVNSQYSLRYSQEKIRCTDNAEKQNRHFFSHIFSERSLSVS